jgi:hypothetical protein
MAIDPLVHTESIVWSIDPTDKKIRIIFAVFAMMTKKTPNFF